MDVDIDLKIIVRYDNREESDQHFVECGRMGKI